MISSTCIFPLGCEFLLPYLEPYGCFVSDMRGCDFILASNSTEPAYADRMREAKAGGNPVAWWTIEDPNSFEDFLPQAAEADFVFTSDEDCIPRYIRQLGHDRVHWLPLGCAPLFHFPQALAEQAADFVISANWYTNRARLWGVEMVVEPLRRTGRTLALFCYENFMWPGYRPYWRGSAGCRTVSAQYRHGRVAIGLNNQRSGMDGREHTVMTSMRTFETLACGKPLLAAQSDAYERLALQHGIHLAAVQTPEEALAWADRLLGEEGERIANAGRQQVLAHHTYGHRLSKIAAVAAPRRYVPGGVTGASQDDATEAGRPLDNLGIEPSLRRAITALAREHDNGNMRYAELLCLAAAMVGFPWTEGQFVCEIGTFHGITAAFLGHLAVVAKLPCRILSVDNFKSPYLADLPEPAAPYYQTMFAHGLMPERNSVIAMSSARAADLIPNGIGLLLVDGDHRYEGCLDDLCRYVPKVVPSGVVAVDDVWYPEVRRAVSEFAWASRGFNLNISLEKMELYESVNE